MARFLSLVLCASSLALVGCGGDSGTDMGPVDSGMDSGGDVDAGTDLGTDGGTIRDLGADLEGLDGGFPDDAATHHIQTVFVLVFENHSWADVVAGNSTYIQSLLPMGARAAMYENPPRNHPSEPNYIWMEAGGNLGIHDDADPATNHQATTAHLVTQLDAAGISWKSYQEDVTDGTHCPLTSVGQYAPKHNPMIYFDDVTDTNSPTSATCIAHVRPFTELATDLAAGTVARYNFITPNLCNDMHGASGCPSDTIGTGDAWLATNLPPILAYANAHDGAVFVTWDESEIIDLPIGMIVLGPYAKTDFTETSTPYTHGSLLRTMQDIFGVGPYLRDAALQQPLANLFTSYP